MSHLVSAIIAVPALGALSLALTPTARGSAARTHALTCASGTLLLGLTLWIAFQPRGVEWQFVDELPFLAYIVGVDGFGALIIVLTALASWCAVVLADVPADRASSHYAGILGIEAGVLGAIASLNLLWFVLFWGVAVLAASRLVRAWDAGEPSVIAQRLTRYLSVATTALVAGILLLVLNVHPTTGSQAFDLRTFQLLSLPLVSQGVVFALFLAAFGIMAGAFPVHVAKRDVIADTPPSVWIPVAVVLSNLGAFGLFRLSLPILPDAARVAAPILGFVSVAGAIFAAIAAARQSQLARFVAYASVAQVSLLLWSSTTLTPLGLTATVVQVVGHTTLMVMLGVTVANAVPPLARLTIGAGFAIVAGGAIYPAPILERVETSVARVILRVSPQHAAEVADCLTAAKSPPPPPEIPGLPAGAVMAAPCETGKP
jgi:NADH-quinone oxidoreductase subunit M